jgi:hypothetical protein
MNAPDITSEVRAVGTRRRLAEVRDDVAPSIWRLGDMDILPE